MAAQDKRRIGRNRSIQERSTIGMSAKGWAGSKGEAKLVSMSISMNNRIGQ